MSQDPPTITQFNTLYETAVGSTATLSVTAQSNVGAALSYQWYSGLTPSTANPIAGATSSTYTTPLLAYNPTANQFLYWVQVTDTGGSTDSLNATVNLESPTHTKTQDVSTSYSPSSQTVNIPVTVTADDISPLNEGNVDFVIPGISSVAERSTTVANNQASVTYTIPAGTPAGTYVIDATYVGPAEVAGSSDDTETLTINKVNATVVVTPYTVTYDGNSHTATVASITGVGGQTGATVGTVTLNSTHTNVGSYSDTYSFAGTANYNSIASTAITDTINKASLVIKADAQSNTYGQSLTLGTSGFTATGLQAGQTVDEVTLSSTGTSATAPVAGSPYAITPSAATGGTFNLANYAISYVAASLTVSKAPLTITANDVSRLYGASDPALGVTYAGFVNGENSAVLGGSLAITDSKSAATTVVGSYTGVIVASGQTSPNYAITSIPGSLTVTKATPSVSVTSPVNLTYGTPLSNAQLVGSATAAFNGSIVNIPGTLTYTSKAGTILNDGNGQVESVTFTPQDTTDYAAVTGRC